MKIITCASYYGCGSSVITDFVSEYNNVKPNTDYEFRFIHDIDGISDLEYHLIECPNRHNSGHALKRFYKLSKFNSGKWFNARYEPFFDHCYMSITNEYIKSLNQFCYKGFWFYDMYDKGLLSYYWYSLLTKLYSKIPCGIFEPLRNEIQYAPILSHEQFIEATRDYVHKLLSKLNKEDYPYLVVDQLLPCSNIRRCLNYFSDPIVLFVFDRDPRDIYISAKLIWTKEHIAPIETPEVFSEWYKFTRQCSMNDSQEIEGVIHLQFEDMIYKYNEMKRIIQEVIGLNDSSHIKQFSRFNPQRSIHNTKLWMRYPELDCDIKIIEKLLPEYLYDFESVKNNKIAGIEPTSTTVF